MWWCLLWDRWRASRSAYEKTRPFWTSGLDCVILMWTFLGCVPPSWPFSLCNQLETCFSGKMCVLALYGGFLKWWYPQNTPKWSFLVGKPMVPPFKKHPFGSIMKASSFRHLPISTSTHFRHRFAKPKVGPPFRPVWGAGPLISCHLGNIENSGAAPNLLNSSHFTYISIYI